MTHKIRFFFFSIIFLLFVRFANGQATYNNEIKQFAVSLYNSFDKMQNISGRLSFNDTSRLKWNNLPVGLRARAGISIGNMTVDQRKLLHKTNLIDVVLNIDTCR